MKKDLLEIAPRRVGPTKKGMVGGVERAKRTRYPLRKKYNNQIKVQKEIPTFWKRVQFKVALTILHLYL